MNKVFVLILMLFFHIVDDYYLQGILSSMKQKEWWKENAPQKLYKYDYIVALIMHSFSWAFMIMLPIALYFTFDISAAYFLALFFNMSIHCFVDDLKANKKKINLVIDQTIHIVQIVITVLICLC